MHNSGGGSVVSAARGLNERYKTVFHIKKTVCYHSCDAFSGFIAAVSETST